MPDPAVPLCPSGRITGLLSYCYSIISTLCLTSRSWLLVDTHLCVWRGPPRVLKDVGRGSLIVIPIGCGVPGGTVRYGCGCGCGCGGRKQRLIGQCICEPDIVRPWCMGRRGALIGQQQLPQPPAPINMAFSNVVSFRNPIHRRPMCTFKYNNRGAPYIPVVGKLSKPLQPGVKVVINALAS